MNLNELDIPEGADEALSWAARIELDLRADSYAQAKLWGIVDGKVPMQSVYNCTNPESQWILDQMREAYDLSDPKHPDWHSVHVDLYDQREGK